MPPVESPVGSPAGATAKGPSPRGELSALKINRTARRRTSPWAILAWLTAGLALLGAIAGAGYWTLKDRLFPLPVVKVESVRIMTLGQARTQLTATGYLESRWQAAVGAKVPGRISNIPVEEGDAVHAGDLLAELEHSDLDAMLASKRVAVKLAEAQQEEAASNLAQAKLDVARERDVYGRLAGTKSALEKAESALTAAQAVLNARIAAVGAAQSAVLEAEEAIRNMFIYAPFDGTVVTKDAEKGESIMPGGMGASSGRGSVITLAKLDELEVDTDVKEDYLGQLRKGQPAQVAVDAVPERRYKGRLREIIPMGDRTRGIVKVKVSILDPDERLFPELSATVNFLPDQSDEGEANAALERGIFAPAGAVVGLSAASAETIARGDAAGDAAGGAVGEEQYVLVLADDNRLRRVAVKAQGEPHEGLVRVTGGLMGGERLVVDPPAGLKEGDEVKVAE